MRTGVSMPALGLGTWRMGERRRERTAEIAALRIGIELGMTLIDTAEMYGEGEAEKIVGEAIAGQRDRVFLVSKVYPHNATRRGSIAACERSLRRLGTDHLDLYLLHWRGNVPLDDTLAGFEALRRAGKISNWGVSNFDHADMTELLSIAEGVHCAANQVLYHLGSRGVEWDLLPFCRQHGIAIMAYSPVGQGDLLRSRALNAIAKQVNASPARVALAWLLSQPGVAAIPKASNTVHVHDNRGAAELSLDAGVLAELDHAFPPPKAPSPLEIH